MAITDYDTLIAAVQRANARANSAFVAALPDLVGMAEERIYHGYGEPDDPLYTPPLRTRVMETVGSIDVTDAAGTLPDDYLSMRKLTRSGDQVGLKYLTPERYDVEMANQSIAATPVFYGIAGNALTVVPAWSGSLDALYYKRFDPISVGNKTGELLTAHGFVYFEATMIEALAWQIEPEGAVGHAAKLRGMIAGLNKSANDLRYSGPLRVRQRQPIP